MSWEYFCPAVGNRLTLGYPRATITPPLFSLPWIRFPWDKKKKYFGGALRAEKFGVRGTNFPQLECCIFASLRPTRSSFKF